MSNGLLRLGLHDLGLHDPIDLQGHYKYKRLIPRYVGPFLAVVTSGVSGFPEEVVVRDFSERGLYFWTDEPPAIGGDVEVKMEAPPAANHGSGGKAQYRATVIRVEESSRGQFGVAALIKSCKHLS
jgi:PilZ domain-containing protein